jgi:hypothetical protein
MARNDRGFFHLEDGNTTDVVPGIVLKQYDAAGDVVADGATNEVGLVTSVDVVLLGWAASKLESVVVGTDSRQFEFTDTLAPA